MKIRNIIIILSLVLFAAACQKSASDQQNDAVFKSIKKTFELKTDGSVVYKYQHKLKYITHLSFNRLYGETFIIYNPLHQEIKFNKVETTMADGKIIVAPENAFNEVLPRFAAGAPAFNHLREMVVTHTGLELGCVVNLDYEVHSKAGYLPFLNENSVLQENVPVENMEIVVKVPKKIEINNNPQIVELNHKLLNLNGDLNTKQEDGFTVYTWTFKNLKAASRESNQPHDGAYLPRLIFTNSTMPNALNHIAKNAGLNLNNEIKGFVTKRISGKKKGMQIIRELQTLVHNEINSFNIPLEYTAYNTRPLTEVWESNGATELEKSLLFNELLKFSGIDSKLIYAIPSEYFDEKTGILNNAGHFYSLVKAEGEDMILSTNPRQTNNLAYELKDYVLLDMDAKTINLPVWLTEVEPSVEVSGNFELSDKGELKGKVDVNVNGEKNPYLNYLADAEKAKEVVQSVIFPNAIKDYSVTRFDNAGSEVQAEIEQEDVWKKQINYYFLTLPESSYGIKAEHLNVLIEERQTPLQLSQTINETYHFTVKLPEGFELTSSVNQKLNNELGSVSVDIKANNDQLQIMKSLNINKDIISPGEYGQFKDLMEIWNKKTYSEIVLKKKDIE